MTRHRGEIPFYTTSVRSYDVGHLMWSRPSRRVIPTLIIPIMSSPPSNLTTASTEFRPSLQSFLPTLSKGPNDPPMQSCRTDRSSRVS